MLSVHTGKVGLMEAYDGFGAACSPNGDFLLPTILFDLILNRKKKKKLVSPTQVGRHGCQMFLRLPDSFSVVLNVRCRSSSQT